MTSPLTGEAGTRPEENTRLALAADSRRLLPS